MLQFLKLIYYSSIRFRIAYDVFVCHLGPHDLQVFLFFVFVVGDHLEVRGPGARAQSVTWSCHQAATLFSHEGHCHAAV